MEIWIVEKGEKRGPFETYEVRGRIEEGELAGDEPAWHKDQDGWVALREMDVFRSAFGESGEERERAHPPPLPEQPFPFLRFFARWFDVLLYMLLFFSLVRFIGDDNLLEAIRSPWSYLYFMPFVLLEAIVLHLTKTTPGKFLLGLRVVTPEEGALSLQAAGIRSLRAYIIGLGLMVLPLLTGICHVYCLWYLMRSNKAPWDTASQNRVRGTGSLRFAIVIFAILFMGICVLLAAVLWPALVEFWEYVRESAGPVD